MARAKRKRRKEQAERLHREPIVREVARILEAGTPTKFRYESTCRHGLRSAFCWRGMGWHPADERARQIVALALARIGASLRPTYRVAGQVERSGTVEYHWCRWCRGRQEPGATSPWCSRDCWEGEHSSRRFEQGRRDEEIARRARRVILAGAEKPELPTEHRCRRCGKLYKPTRERQKYCSHDCYVATGPALGKRDCLVCGEAFVPNSAIGKYCSTPCAKEAARRKVVAILPASHHKACISCGAAFVTRRSFQVTCSPACGKAAALAKQATQRRERQRNLSQLRGG